MSPKITSEQRAALAAHAPGQPIRVVDEENDREFWLVAPEDVPALWAEHIHAEVQRGVEAIDRGDVVPWNPEAMKQFAREAARKATTAE